MIPLRKGHSLTTACHHADVRGARSIFGPFSSAVVDRTALLILATVIAIEGLGEALGQTPHEAVDGHTLTPPHRGKRL